MPRPTRAAALALAPLAAALAATPALAQVGFLGDERDAPFEDDGLTPFQRGYTPDWRVRFDLAAFFVAGGLDVTLPGGGSAGFTAPSTEFDFDELNIDEPTLAPFGELHVARDKFRLTFSGFGLETDGAASATTSGRIGDAPFFTGETIDTELEFQSFQLTGSYRVLGYSDAPQRRREGFAVRGGLDLIGGVRFHRVSFESSVAPTSAARAGLGPLDTDTSVDEVFGEIIGGARLDLLFGEFFGIDVEATGGGFGIGDRTTGSFDINAGFSFYPNPNVAAQIGFRLLALSLEDGEDDETFDLNGSFSGLYWGVNVAF